MTGPESAKEILLRALDLPKDDRASYLEEACGDDLSLRARVERLLAVEDEAGDFLATATGGPAAAAASAHVAVGTVIDRYRILQLLGEGGFGSVYLAEQEQPVRRRVALKIIKLGMDTREVIARFEAERQALAMMDHPGIAKVFDAGATTTGRPYFVMELVKGIAITEYCDRHQLSVPQRLELFRQVCSAVQHAHQKGIIHRDLKPSNVLVSIHDGKPVPMVIDFGIAKATSARLTEKTIFTQHSQLIGTPEYMSPEQAEMSGLDIDTRSDIYSLGVLLYELLTGVTPFDARKLRSVSYAEIQRIIREEDPLRPSTRLASLDALPAIAAQRRADPRKLGLMLRGDLDWIVMKAMEKDRNRRYETADGFAADIERHLNDNPVTASPPSSVYRLRKFVRRHRGPVAAVVAIAIVLVGGVAGTTTGLVSSIRANDALDLALEDAQRQRTLAEDNAAKATAQATRAERELTRANEVKRLITEMLASVDPEAAKGEDITLLRRLLDRTSERLLGGEIEDPLIEAELHGVIGVTYEGLGLYDYAERHVPAAEAMYRRELGADHPATLAAIGNLGSLRWAQGRYDEAEQCYAQALEGRRRILGDDHEETLTTLSNLAGFYISRGRGRDAERLYVEVIERWKRVLGPEHEKTLGAMNNLALVYREQGRLSEAEQLYRDTLEVQRRVIGDEHPHTLMSMGNLGMLYLGQHRYREAEQMLLELREMQLRVLGPDHPQTHMTSHNLGNVYMSQGRTAEAKEIYLEVLDARTDLLGPDHPQTLGTATNLGLLYAAEGEPEEARKLLETALTGYRRLVGVSHPATRTAMTALAGAYDRLGRHEDALPLHRELLEYEVARAEEPDAGAEVLNTAAWRLLMHDDPQLRDPIRARGFAERACAAEEADGGSSLWMYLDTLALTQHHTGDHAAAVETQRRAIALRPDDASEAARAEMAEHLATFEAALTAGE